MNGGNRQPTTNPWRKAGQIGKAILVSAVLFLSILTLLSFQATRAYEGTGPSSVDTAVIPIPPFACDTDSLVLADYQVWHGLPTHLQPPPYTSTNPAVITGHILAAQARCIDGFVVDWYGPPAGMPNDEDRKFMDDAFAELLQQAEVYDFKVAILYDESTLTGAESLAATHAISDLLYATKYFTSSGYLSIDDNPALFIFPYPQIDAQIDWEVVRTQLPMTVTLFDKDPDPSDPTHDASFDGFYAWVQPAGPWQEDGTEWGEEYLRWFYNTMANEQPYVDKIAIGGVWPGFDDTLASWGSGRYMWRRCGQTWVDTWDIAEEFTPSIVMIDTWNDFEEGTDIEYGVGECLSPPHDVYIHRGREVVFTHTLTNTGKFIDTFHLEASSPRGLITTISADTIMLPAHASTTFTATLAVPPNAAGCGQNLLGLSATSALNAAVGNTLNDSATVLCTYLPIVLKNLWQENFDPIRETWSQDTARWVDPPGPTATLIEDNPNPDENFGKSESEVITHYVTDNTTFRVKATHVDPGSSYTIQLDDKETDVKTDIFKGITVPGEHVVYIRDIMMGWQQGTHVFTINVWISGEGKSTTFEFIGFEEVEFPGRNILDGVGR